MYLHGPQLCPPPFEKPRALFLRSSGPLDNHLLKQNGRKHNRLLKPAVALIMYEWLQSYIAVCEMLQIKPMTALHRPFRCKKQCT